MKFLPSRTRRVPAVAGAIAAVAVAGLAAPALAGGGAERATASIVDATGATIGFAQLTEDAAGRTHLNVHVHGLTPGEHGIHVHATGSCVGPAFASASGHFNPTGHSHGFENPGGHHAGDLPNLLVNEAGVGRLTAVTDAVTLSSGTLSLFDHDGSAIVVHANADDHVTNPSGNSGARVACGVIAAK